MSNIIKSQLQCQFQRFLNQTLCVFSQMKDIKYIGWDFYSVAWVMPQGLELGGAGDLGMGSKDQIPLDILESVGSYQQTTLVGKELKTASTQP